MYFYFQYQNTLTAQKINKRTHASPRARKSSKNGSLTHPDNFQDTLVQFIFCHSAFVLHITVTYQVFRFSPFKATVLFSLQRTCGTVGVAPLRLLSHTV